ncbi:MAG: histidine phosphatase family protein [Actinomycetota bacterium]|nr:histidine phosphatase family protein [Actinomycetota bacterium]
MKIVILARHAKSSHKDTSLEDSDRPLKKRGLRDLESLQPVLVGHEHKPERIFSSIAKRAAESARVVAAFYGLEREGITCLDELYGASAREIVAFIRSLDDGLRSVMVVGHNPDLALAADLLRDEPFEAQVPTSAFICLSFDVDIWREVRENTGVLEFYEYPRKSG